MSPIVAYLAGVLTWPAAIAALFGAGWAYVAFARWFVRRRM